MPITRGQTPANQTRLEIMHAAQSDVTVSTAPNNRELRRSILQVINDLDAVQKGAEQDAAAAAAALDKVAHYPELIKMLRDALPPEEPMEQATEAVEATAASCETQKPVTKDTLDPQEITSVKEGLQRLRDWKAQKPTFRAPKRRRLTEILVTRHEDEDESDIVPIR